MNKNDSYTIVDDLSKFLLCELKEKHMAISHFRLQKSIFKIKMELGKNHPLYEQLPFYWYEHGPFSNVVSKQFNQLKSNNCTQYTSCTVFLDEKSFNKFSKEPNNLINEYPLIKDISDKIFEDPNVFFNKFDEDIYLEYAPFSFMHPFKYILYETTRTADLCSSLVVDDYLNVFYDCLSRLPYDDLLVEFSVLFSRLFSRLELINDENQFFNSWKFISKSISKSWCTFARWVSIYKHDTFYNDDIFYWKNDLDKRVKSFNKSVNYLEDKTDSILNNPPQDDYAFFEDRIYNATIGNYLMD